MDGGTNGIDVTVLALVALRIGSMLFTAPFYGNRAISFRFRIALCAVVAFSILPLVGSSANEIGSDDSFVSLAFTEILTGALFGLGIQVAFRAIVIAGQAISKPFGLSEYANAGTENVPQEGATARLLDLSALSVFILTGGPELLLSSILDSFAVQPIGTGEIGVEKLNLLAAAIPFAFTLGLKIAGPVLACQLIATLGVGLMGRAIGQSSLLHIAMPIGMIVTLVAILYSLGSMNSFFVEQNLEYIQQLSSRLFGAD